ncbi:MAG: insulinase family protein [Candidatus Kapabacteria bacterium]|nr:insulinase family protein [Candidatus Kapabacteria bacterium]
MTLRQLLAVAIIAALTGTAVYAQNYKPLKYTEYTLPNGLQVILHRDNSVPIAATVLHYKVGSRYEDPARTGFAHFFEHLMFEGTDSIPRGGVGDIFQRAGGELNAFTSFDKTVYHVKLPSNGLQLAMWVDAQRMRDLRVDTIGIETQRGVVKEERKQRYDNSPYGVWNEKMFTLLFKGSGYGWTPIGSSQHIDVASLKEFRDFYDQYYVPNNAVLVVSGDFDENEVRKYIDVYYGSRPRGKDIQRPVVAMPAMNGEIRETINDNKAQLPGLFIGYRGVKLGDPDGYAMEMLTDILANGESSRMYRRLVDKEQVAVQASTFPYQLEQAGAIVLVGIAAPGADIAKVENLMYAEIDSVIKNGVTDAEFQKAKNIAEMKFISGKKGVLENALALADAKATFNNTDYVNTEIQNFYRVTKADLQRVAKKYFETKNRVVLTFMPSAEKKKK